MKKIVVLLVTLCCMAGALQAQGRFSAGVRGGLLSRTYTFDQKSLVFTDAKGNATNSYNQFSSESKYGFEAGVNFRVRLWKSQNEMTGASLLLELDGLYAQNNLVLLAGNEGDELNKWSATVITRTVDVPLMLCLKASVVRLSAGPVFHAFAKYDLKKGSPNIGFDSPRVLCGYSLGIGFDFGKVTLDGRYSGNFKKDTWTINNGTSSTTLTGRCAGWSICLGVAF
ncbi:MAG: hypothetical protein E7128_04145 [Rikenellaceae bacterium]|nr:hypothetical protein [Rikenellaceae bacterium]MBR2443308.1 hypothetical protein [Rikenellaceae bacterium]